MLNVRCLFQVATMAGVLLVPAVLPAQTSGASADNSKQNSHQPTNADQQHTGASDREITRKIRQAVVKDKSLSTYGHNVKIVTLNGAVTLAGPVHTDAEKQNIGSKAADVAGQDKVTNNITVKQ